MSILLYSIYLAKTTPTITTTTTPTITPTTATSITTDVLVMYETLVAGLLDNFQNLFVGEIVMEFNGEINAGELIQENIYILQEATLY